MTGNDLGDWVRDARERTCALVSDLTPEQMIGPRLLTVNPLLWEIGHVAWFQEKWVLRRDPGYRLVRADADALYDSAAVGHETRWDLPLPDFDGTIHYLHLVRDRVLDRLAEGRTGGEDAYFTLLSVFHEDMHAEAFLYTRQTLAYGAPLGIIEDGNSRTAAEPEHFRGAGGSKQSLEDVPVPGGVFQLGAPAGEPFVFDNEKWAHAVEVRPFAIGRLPVTQAEFAAFVEEGGYRQERFWTTEGWGWRSAAGAQQPVYWQRQSAGRWLRRDFERWIPLEPQRPMLHVNWHEANAYCRWASRRLPTEAEWEMAAASVPDATGHGPAPAKRRFPWGNSPPSRGRANLDGCMMGAVDVHCLPAGDSAFGCRQMIGNVWEWTASDFLPYPGFVADPYKEYSAPWFGTHKVLRGGAWTTRARLLRNTWRNFYRPERRDVWAGFRTCALEP